MQRTQLVPIQQNKEVETTIVHFSLPGLLPSDQKLALNLEMRTLSLMREGPILIQELLFSVNEMQVLVPILDSFPHYCPYEILLASLSSNHVTSASIARCRQRLQEARDCGEWQQELRPIRRALSSLRVKLHRCNLEISNVRERGCSLISLTATHLSS